MNVANQRDAQTAEFSRPTVNYNGFLMNDQAIGLDKKPVNAAGQNQQQDQPANGANDFSDLICGKHLFVRQLNPIPKRTPDFNCASDMPRVIDVLSPDLTYFS